MANLRLIQNENRVFKTKDLDLKLGDLFVRAVYFDKESAVTGLNELMIQYEEGKVDESTVVKELEKYEDLYLLGPVPFSFLDELLSTLIQEDEKKRAV